MSSIWRIISLLPDYRGRVAGVLATSAAIALIGCLTPFIFRAVIDGFAAAERGAAPDLPALLAGAVALFALFRLALIGLGFLQHRQSAQLWLDQVGSLRKRVFDDMAALALSHYEKARVGDIMDRFGAIIPVSQWLRDLVETSLALVLQLVFSLVILLVVAPAAGLVMAIAAPINLYGAWRSLSATRPHRRRWQKLGGRMGAILNEMLSQIATVRVLNGEEAVRRRFGDAHRSWGEARLDEWRIDRFWTTALLAVNGLALTLVAVLIVTSAFAGRHSIGDVLLVLTLAQGIVGVLAPVARAINSAGDTEAAAERLMELLDAAAPASAPAIDVAPLDRIEAITFEHVSFSYPGVVAPVLEDVSFTLAQGKSVALAGPSGSGKSTIVKLILRLYEPSAGRILLNGRDIRDFDVHALRARLGIVLQDVALFNDTIAGNIAFGRSEAAPAQIAEAARLAHADSFIRALPGGYETELGERGAQLSGGERQRIAVARAIFRDPDLVILDEATSALDAQSERLVQAGLEQLMRGRASLVIAHRLSTIAAADEILVLHNGRIAERGAHADLIAREGLYRRLSALQGAAPVAAAS